MWKMKDLNIARLNESKLAKEEFWELTTKRDTDYWVFLETQTDICKYWQAFNIEEFSKERYLDFYYDLYLKDCDIKDCDKKFRNQLLVCWCCGNYFHTWKWYVNQDQDVWYWICRGCQKADTKQNKAQYEKIFQLIYNGLNKKNQKKADEMIMKDKDWKIMLVNIWLNKWRVKWSIWKSE